MMSDDGVGGRGGWGEGELGSGLAMLSGSRPHEMLLGRHRNSRLLARLRFNRGRRFGGIGTPGPMPILARNPLPVKTLQKRNNGTGRV